MSELSNPLDMLANDTEYSELILEGRLGVSYHSFRNLAHGHLVNGHSVNESILVFPKRHEFVRSLAVLSTSSVLEVTVNPIGGDQHIFSYDKERAKVAVAGGVPPSLVPELAYGYERVPRPNINPLYRSTVVVLIIMNQILDEASQLLQQKDKPRVSILPVSTDTV